jgi:cytochrome c oxidase subunit 4
MATEAQTSGTATAAVADAGHGHDEHGAHASVGFYWMIGGILAVLTAVEVAAFYMELGAVEVPLLLILSAAKFIIVVMFFMHLRFDSKVFTGVFMAGMVLAMFIVTALIVLYHVLPGYQV